jgi:hypothetical protein
MSDNLSNLFERRERNIGKPLRPPQPAATTESPPSVATPAEPRHAPRPRRTKPVPPTAGHDAVERYSIFLSHEQAQWLKALRGRLLVEGKDISASEVVRLALERLRSVSQTDQQLYDAANVERGHIRSRGRPARRG